MASTTPNAVTSTPISTTNPSISQLQTTPNPHTTLSRPSLSLTAITIRATLSQLSLPSTADITDDSNTACFICGDDFFHGPHPEPPLKLRCGHIFGAACILKWAITRGHNTCPLCMTTGLNAEKPMHPDLLFTTAHEWRKLGRDLMMAARTVFLTLFSVFIFLAAVWVVWRLLWIVLGFACAMEGKILIALMIGTAVGLASCSYRGIEEWVAPARRG